MNKNALLALLVGAILILGALSLLTGDRIFILLGMLIGATTKLWLNFFPIKDKPPATSPSADKVDDDFFLSSKIKKPKRLIWGKVDFAAIALGCLITCIAGLAFYFVCCAALTPTVYFYLRNIDYAHNAFPIASDFFEQMLIGLAAGSSVAIFSRVCPLTNVFLSVIVFEAITLLFFNDSLSEDPLWYSITTDALFCSFFIIGGFIGKAYRAKHPPNSSQSLAPHFIWCVSLAITLFLVGMFVDRRITLSPPPDILQQMVNMAANGDKLAEKKLGDYYRLGQPKDLTKAAEYYTQAAQRGDSYSQIQLGRMFYKGDGVKTDCLAAYEWFALAQKSKNHLPVSGEVEAAKSELTPVEITTGDKWVADWKPVSK